MQRNIERKNGKKQVARHNFFRMSSFYNISPNREKRRFLSGKNRQFCAFRSSLIYRQSPIREKSRFLFGKNRQLCAFRNSLIYGQSPICEKSRFLFHKNRQLYFGQLILEFVIFGRAQTKRLIQRRQFRRNLDLLF